MKSGFIFPILRAAPSCAGNGVLTAARDRCPHRVAPLSLEQVIAFDRCIGMADKTMLERISGMLSLDIVTMASVPADCPSLT